MVYDQVTAMFDKSQEPIARVRSGELLVVQTRDCYNGQIHSEDQDLSALDHSFANPATGPFYVEGAEKGDALKVEILDIRMTGRGFTHAAPSIGPLKDSCEERLVMYDYDGGFAEFRGIRFPLKPMIGTIGCTPETPIPDLLVGDHGGNMDCTLIGAGTTLYCPVCVPGALFQLGDVHAAMGDGELCGTGLETGAEVTLRLSLVKGAGLKLPVLETADRWYTIGHGKEYYEALKKTSGYLQELIMKAYGWDATDAYLYLSVQGDVEVCQSCAPCAVEMVLRCGVPKQPGKPLVKG